MHEPIMIMAIEPIVDVLRDVKKKKIIIFYYILYDVLRRVKKLTQKNTCRKFLILILEELLLLN